MFPANSVSYTLSLESRLLVSGSQLIKSPAPKLPSKLLLPEAVSVFVSIGITAYNAPRAVNGLTMFLIEPFLQHLLHAI